MTPESPDTVAPLTEDDVRRIARETFATEFHAQWTQLHAALATDAEVTV